MADRPHLRRLTSLRWYAALAVFVSHFGDRLGWSEPIFPTLGYAGVGLFFVLSGVVLTWSAPDGDTAQAFYRRRFARIYPAAMVSAVGVVVLALATGAPVHWTITSLIAFVLMIQAWFPGRMWAVYNGVEWTLSCEAFFYALFPLLRRGLTRLPQRRVSALAAEFVVLSVLVVIAFFPATVALHLPALRLSEFLAGMGIGTALRRGWVPRIPLAPAAVGYALLVYGAAELPLAWFLALPGAVALLSAAAGADLRGERSWLTSRSSVYLGEVSFCFYLVHEQLMARISIAGVAGAALIVALPISLLAAIALHHGVELPLHRRLSYRPALAKRQHERAQRPSHVVLVGTNEVAEV